MTEVKKKKLPCYLHPGCLCPKIWALLDPHPSLSLHGSIVPLGLDASGLRTTHLCISLMGTSMLVLRG